MTWAISFLTADHRSLRAQLDLVESALRQGEEAALVVREFCFRLSKQLEEHVEREHPLLESCRGRTQPPAARAFTKTAAVYDHEEVRECLQVILHYAIHVSDDSAKLLYPAIESVVDALQEEMTGQETEVFPLMDGRLTAEGEDGSLAFPRQPAAASYAYHGAAI